MNPYETPRAPKQPRQPWNTDRIFGWLAVVVVAFVVLLYVVAVG